MTAVLVICYKEFIAKKNQIVFAMFMLRRLNETNTLALAEELFQKGRSLESSRHCKLWDTLFNII